MSIFLCDIVGFTNLASESTAHQIVAFIPIYPVVVGKSLYGVISAAPLQSVGALIARQTGPGGLSGFKWMDTRCRRQAALQVWQPQG